MRALSPALDHIRSQPCQYIGSFPQWRKSLASALSQFTSSDLGGLKTQHTGVGGLGACRVRAAGLADLFGLALDVENVILDLKGETDVLRIAIQCVP